MQTALIRKDHSIAHVSMGTLVMVSLVQVSLLFRRTLRLVSVLVTGLKLKKTYDLSETPDPFNCLKTWSRSYFLCLSLKNKRKKYRKDRLSLHEIILIQMQLLQTISANPNFGLRYSLERRKYTRLDLMLCMRVSAAAKYSRKEIIHEIIYPTYTFSNNALPRKTVICPICATNNFLM